VRHIHVGINVADMRDCRGNVEMETRIFTTLTKADIPMDASALMRLGAFDRHAFDRHAFDRHAVEQQIEALAK
jgi:hypothetical protein